MGGMCFAALCLTVALFQSDSPTAEARALEERSRAALAAAQVTEARALALEGLDLTLQLLGEEDTATVCELLEELGILARDSGALERAREAHEIAVELRSETGNDEDPGLLGAQSRLALTLFYLGDRDRARELQEHVLRVREETLPEHHPDLTEARNNLALTLIDYRELNRALELQEAVLLSDEKTLPPDHLDLLLSRVNLGATLQFMDEFERARTLFDAAVEGYERAVPDDHPLLARARNNLAVVLRQMGDVVGARALQEDVLTTYEAIYPPEHPALLTARQNLASTLADLEEAGAARELLEAVLAVQERVLPPGHPSRRVTTMDLAMALNKQHDYQAALELEKRVLASIEEVLPNDHADVLAARFNLAVTLAEMYRFEEAGEQLERVVSARERTLPKDNDQVLDALAMLGIMRAYTGDSPGAAAVLSPLADGLLTHFSGLRARSAREVQARIADASGQVDKALYLSTLDESGQTIGFEIAETRRSVALPPPRRLAGDAETKALREAVVDVRRRLNNAVAGGLGDDWRSKVVSLSRERDRLEERWNSKLAAAGALAGSVRAASVAEALEPGQVAVGFLRYRRYSPDEPAVDNLLAHVVRRDGTLARVELGRVETLEQLVESWRRRLGRSSGRGVPIGGTRDEHEEREAGEALRRALLDPILQVLDAEAEGVTLVVCPDDLVYLVPLDALPLGNGRVGDRHGIVQLTSFASLIAPRARPPGDPAFVAIGGVGFGAREGLAEPSTTTPTRARTGWFFPELPHTRGEAEALGELFEESWGEEPLLLLGRAATKEAFVTRAGGARYLHVATHGWFEPETIASTADVRPLEGWRRAGARQVVSGLAPMTLCGLALAGANQGRDSLGRVPGILTAEELCSLDLSSCELAVLSACETNVRVRRAGQGIQSLQAALDAAGARSSLTSLWKVDDAATRRLMELFYTHLWKDELPKSRALWKAKLELRDEGAPVRDWAGWVLTGEAD